MDALTLLDKYGFSIAAACAGFWFIVKLVNYVLNDLKGSTESLEAITIKLIDKENEQNKTICELERTLSELSEQHRCLTSLLICGGSGPRVRDSEEREKLRD